MMRHVIVGVMVIGLLASAVLADYGVNQAIEDVASASFVGEEEQDAAGTVVAPASDVDGDGYMDFLVTAPLSQENDTGQVYLIFGKATGWDGVLYTSLSAADASFVGEDPNDAVGTSAVGVGDVNGDGFDDLVIGAPSNGDAGSQAGKAYLILGHARPWSMRQSLTDADASFLGENAGDSAGFAVAAAGDVNQDGLADFLVGAPQASSSAGKVYVIFGKASGWARNVSLGSTAGASFAGDDAFDLAGYSVAGVGDVNGDGVGDILVGAWGDSDVLPGAGSVYLIFGKPAGQPWPQDAALSTVSIALHGSLGYESAGVTVARAGDVNGDGYGDFLVGANGAHNGAGKTYLIFGKASGWMSQDLVTVAAAIFMGEAQEDSSGTSLAGGGDINGDGHDDLLIGAPDKWRFSEGDSYGKAYLIYGQTSWPSPAIVNLRDADASFWGQRINSRAGTSLAVVGDVNGDSFDDFMVGADQDHHAADGAGQAYLLVAPTSNNPAIQAQFIPAGDAPRADFGSTEVQIDFSAGTAGMVTVTKHRERPADLPQAAAVWWEISTTKAAFLAELTFYYANSEIAGLAEAQLKLFWRPDASAAWQRIPATLNTAYNKITAQGIQAFGQYALSTWDVPPPTLTPTPITPTPIVTASATPTAAPTTVPTAEPTAAPTTAPTSTPTATPTAAPTAEPTTVPTATPTSTPTDTPMPTHTPTSTPTDTPVPTDTPTSTPTDTPMPTATPTATPTDTPMPTATPTATPTDTSVPTATPTATPTPLPPTPTPTPLPPTATPTVIATVPSGGHRLFLPLIRRL